MFVLSDKRLSNWPSYPSLPYVLVQNVVQLVSLSVIFAQEAGFNLEKWSFRISEYAQICINLCLLRLNKPQDVSWNSTEAKHYHLSGNVPVTEGFKEEDEVLKCLDIANVTVKETAMLVRIYQQ